MPDTTPAGTNGQHGARVLDIVRFFDELVLNGAGIDGLVRGGAMLSGRTVGADLRGHTVRRAADGTLLEPMAPPPVSLTRQGDGWRVWLESRDENNADETVILERLAVSVAMVESRRGPENALEIVVDPERSADERAAALARLRIRAGDHLRLIATAVDAAAPAGPSVVMATKYGPLRATVVRAGDVAVSGRAGLGPTVVALRAPASWEAAMVGLRLSSEKDPVVDGSDLGAMVLLARWADPAVPHPDVVTLEKLDPHNHEILRALVETDSVRAAAARLAMHHSTVQARLQSLVRMLGFDPRTALGRMRYIAANLLLRLRHPQP